MTHELMTGRPFTVWGMGTGSLGNNTRERPPLNSLERNQVLPCSKTSGTQVLYPRLLKSPSRLLGPYTPWRHQGETDLGGFSSEEENILEVHNYPKITDQGSVSCRHKIFLFSYCLSSVYTWKDNVKINFIIDSFHRELN